MSLLEFSHIAFQNSPIPVVILDKDLNILSASKKFETLFGYSGHEYMGRNIEMVLDISRLMTLIKTPSLFESMEQIYGKDREGSRFKLEVKIVIEQLKAAHVYVVYIRDLSFLQGPELALMRERKRFEDIFEKSYEAHILFNDQNRVVDFNKAALEMFRYEADEFRRMHPSEFSPEFQEDGASSMVLAEKYIKEVFEKGQVRFEWLHKRATGEVFYCDITLVRFDLEDDLLWFSSIRDISERKLMEKKLEKTNREMKNAIETKDKFLSLIGHDLRTPFNTILGFSSLIYDNYDAYSEEKRKKFIKMIHDSALKGNELLSNLLQWSRLQSNKIQYHPEMLDSMDFIEGIIDSVRMMASQKDISVELGCMDHGRLFADRNMLSTIMRNLLSNAIKFSREGSKVMLNCRRKLKAIEFEVKDQGIGMSKEQIEAIFNDRLRSSPGTNNEGGTGLGLKLVKEFVHVHKGEMDIESEMDKGTRFRFSIPLFE